MAMMIEHGSVGSESRLKEKPAGMIKGKSAQNMFLDRKWQGFRGSWYFKNNKSYWYDEGKW